MNRPRVCFVVDSGTDVRLVEGLAEVRDITLQESRSTPYRRIEDDGSIRFTREVILHDDRSRMIETIDSLALLQRIPRVKTP
jgi:hypothetical protein